MSLKVGDLVRIKEDEAWRFRDIVKDYNFVVIEVKGSMDKIMCRPVPGPWNYIPSYPVFVMEQFERVSINNSEVKEV